MNDNPDYYDYEETKTVEEELRDYERELERDALSHAYDVISELADDMDDETGGYYSTMLADLRSSSLVNAKADVTFNGWTIELMLDHHGRHRKLRVYDGCTFSGTYYQPAEYEMDAEWVDE